MQFLRTLFWVVIAVFLAIVASRNWRDVTLDLWGNLQADIKIPVLLLLVFLAGFLPPFLLLRARRWRDRRQTVSPAVAPALVRAPESIVDGQ